MPHKTIKHFQKMFFGNEIGNLKGLFYDGVVIDDVVFKLHYGFTSYLLLFMTFLSVSKVFFNEPIYCSMGAYEYEKIISKEMLNNYCYIHSTFIVPNSAQYLDDSLYAYRGVGPYSLGDQGSVVFHSYYQWISLLLFIQGIICTTQSTLSLSKSTDARLHFICILKYKI